MYLSLWQRCVAIPAYTTTQFSCCICCTRVHWLIIVCTGWTPNAPEQPQEQRYPVLQVYAGSFRACSRNPLGTLTWTSGSLTCVRDHSYTHGCWAHQQRVSTTVLTRKNSHNFFLCSWRGWGLNLRSLDLEFDALPIEPPRHLLTSVFPKPPFSDRHRLFCVALVLFLERFGYEYFSSCQYVQHMLPLCLSPWYDLRGWLDRLKNQLFIHLTFVFIRSFNLRLFLSNLKFFFFNLTVLKRQIETVNGTSIS